ncbi:hypothetical protein Q4Q35_09335 [Flavivirga aquimarina]|uniref:Peptidase C39-like domain-containing protein n=1 Tax=Flavivirga aquimarina TaxID=2027862 RepID=A0ABT8WAC0_9FLAO|nr:hypothetical protein [Flavivirga aquimarina]MDO5970012.1 hypothetical protein [Flavivirga aquimarina]
MPDISLANLAGIPGVDQAAMTQNNPNACGAYTIIGAVGAFDVFPLVADLAYANLGPQAVDNASATALADNYHQLSAAVYTITGILNDDIPNPPGAVVPELLAAGNVYNSPAAMAQVAINLGRVAPQINVQAAGYMLLNTLYPGETPRCTGVVGAGNVDVAAGDYAAPGANETHVVCVQVNGGGLHWVAQGSDDQFYDPADGSLNNAWAPVNTGDAMGVNYTFSGLWMVIS